MNGKSCIHDHFLVLFGRFQMTASVGGKQKRKKILPSTWSLFLRRASRQLHKVPLLDLLTLSLRMAALIERRIKSGFIDGSVAATV